MSKCDIRNVVEALGEYGEEVRVEALYRFRNDYPGIVPPVLSQTSNGTPVWIRKPSEILRSVLLDSVYSELLVSPILTETNTISEISDTAAFAEAINGLGSDAAVKIGIVYTTDEASANASKRWNYAENSFCFFANLPMKKRCYHLIATLNAEKLDVDNSAAWSEILELVVDDLKALRRGIPMFCASAGHEIVVKAALVGILADNPRANNVASIVAPSGTYSCRICTG
jgi:hypothetical protein